MLNHVNSENNKEDSSIKQVRLPEDAEPRGGAKLPPSCYLTGQSAQG